MSVRKPYLKEIIVRTTADIVLDAIRLIDKPHIHKDLYLYLFEETPQKCNISDISDYKKYFEKYVISTRIKKFSKLIKISKSPEMLHKFLITGEQLIIDRYYDIEKKYDVMIKDNINTVVGISRDEFINSANETYKDDSSIIRQSLLDFPRETIYVNGVLITDIDEMIKILTPYNRMVNINGDINVNIKTKKQITTSLLALLMICQSSFYVSFIHIFNKILKLKELILDTTDERHNLHLVHGENKIGVNITISSDTFLCSFDARYKLIDIVKNETIRYIDTEILFDIDSDISLVVYSC